MRSPLYAVLVAATLASLVGCAGADSARPPGGRPTAGTTSSPATPPSPTTSGGASPTATATPDPAEALLARLSLAQRAGQLVMVGTPATATSSAARSAIGRYHVGNVMLTGRSSRGVTATAALTHALQRRTTDSATAGVRLFVATDQEGGKVQVLSGPGFSPIPSGTTQGSWSATTLRSRAEQWGGQLRRAGVNLTLGPVADTVPTSLGTANPPIGFFHRQFASTPTAVSRSLAGYDAGMKAAGVDVAPKHFPGLGWVRANTDTTSVVRDSTTTTSSPDLAPFQAAVAAGAPFVMVSSAIYTRIDPAHPACFSSAVITDLLRGRLGFDGVVISDDLGDADAVRRWSPGSRAVQFVGAGGDVALTVDPALAAPMAVALVARAKQSAAFRAQLDAAVLRVLHAKAAAGLLPS
ncbi:glycoside hydrolase family 3 N-terminal domain-containing protein [Angustibacter sp. McL0619]|uniref:glycoside hydrolase family 3 N-terminal domain-containing protein n=1 Tax=Angustibacter sp. McL0619 TaxID=3415676 RepID=UPI003CF95077